MNQVNCFNRQFVMEDLKVMFSRRWSYAYTGLYLSHVISLQEVDHFQYLGAMITEDGKCEADMRSRLGMARSVLSELEHIWKSRAIKLSTKLRLLRSLVWPVGTYGAEAWSFGKWEHQRLLSFEKICYSRVMRVPWTA